MASDPADRADAHQHEAEDGAAPPPRQDSATEVGSTGGRSNGDIKDTASETPSDRDAPAEAAEKEESATAAANAEPKTPERSQARILLIMLALGLALFLAALDISIITTALPTITEYFHSSAGYTWIGSSYLLAVSATTIVWGKLSDVFGRKPMLLLANAVFFVGSLIAALSVNVGMLIFARAVQGCGGAGLNVLVNICIGDIFSPRQRGAYYSVIGGVWALALALGPVVGGALSQNVTWRWCFYINLPFDGLAFIIILIFLDVKTPKTPLIEGLKAIDWVGVLLSIGGSLMFLFGLSFGNVEFPWKSATVIALIIAGVVCWALCLIWEARFAKFPLLPTHIFRNRGPLAALAICFFQSFVYIASAYYLPLYFQAILGASPTLSGVYLLPTAICLSIASIGTGIYMRKTGHYLIPVIAGFVLQTLGYGLYIDLGPTADWAKIILFQVVAGFGVGPNFQAPLVALQSLVSPRYVASATSAFAFTRNLAGGMSVVIGQVVFQNRMGTFQDQLVAALGPEQAQQLGGGNAGANTEIIRTLLPAQREVAHAAFASSLSYLWIMYTCFSAAGLLASALIRKNTPLTEEHKETETGLEAEKAARQERLQEKGGRDEASAGESKA